MKGKSFPQYFFFFLRRFAISGFVNSKLFEFFSPKCSSGHAEISFGNTSLKLFRSRSEKKLKIAKKSSENFSGWKCPSGHVEIICGNTSQAAEIFPTKPKKIRFSDFFKKKSLKMFVWKSVLRISIFVQNCTYWAKSESPRTLGYLCFSWSF